MLVRAPAQEVEPSAGGGAKRATRSEASETDDARMLVRAPAQEVEPSAGGGAQRATRSEASETDDARMLVRAPAQEVEPLAEGDGGRSRRTTATLVATLYSLTAMRTVESATERSLPGAPGQVTVTASFHKRTAIAVAALSRSGVEPGGTYCAITAVHA